jgi:uncharacterized membrane protein
MRLSRFCLSLGLSSFLLCAGHATASAVATFTPLGDLPGGAFFSLATGLSADGSTVVGGSRVTDQISGQIRAFRWSADTGMVAIGHVGSPSASGFAYATSADGSVVVGNCGVAFRWTDESGMIDIGDCSAISVRDDGAVVAGSCNTPIGLQAATWTVRDGWTLHGAAGVDFTDAFFSGISADGSVFCGQSMIQLPFVEPIRWTPRTGFVPLGDVPGGLHYALGWGISADGTTIVGDAIGDVGLDAFIWRESTGLVNLELVTPAMEDSSAQGASVDGCVVAGYSDLFGATAWDAQNLGVSLQSLLDRSGVDMSGWTLTGAIDVSDDGRVFAGSGFNPQGVLEAWRAEFPHAPRAADVEFDGVVNGADLAVLLATWGSCDGCPADLDRSGIVDSVDLALLLGAWD